MQGYLQGILIMTKVESNESVILSGYSHSSFLTNLNSNYKKKPVLTKAESDGRVLKRFITVFNLQGELWPKPHSRAIPGSEMCIG